MLLRTEGPLLQWKKEMPTMEERDATLVKLKHAASHSRRTETTGNEVYCGKFVMEEYYVVYALNVEREEVLRKLATTCTNILVVSEVNGLLLDAAF
jgi:hypothetical protein